MLSQYQNVSVWSIYFSLSFFLFFYEEPQIQLRRPKFFPNVSYYFFQCVIENIEIQLFFKETLNSVTFSWSVSQFSGCSH